MGKVRIAARSRPGRIGRDGEDFQRSAGGRFDGSSLVWYKGFWNADVDLGVPLLAWL